MMIVSCDILHNFFHLILQLDIWNLEAAPLTLLDPATLSQQPIASTPTEKDKKYTLGHSSLFT